MDIVVGSIECVEALVGAWAKLCADADGGKRSSSSSKDYCGLQNQSSPYRCDASNFQVEVSEVYRSPIPLSLILKESEPQQSALCVKSSAATSQSRSDEGRCPELQPEPEGRRRHPLRS